MLVLGGDVDMYGSVVGVVGNNAVKAGAFLLELLQALLGAHVDITVARHVHLLRVQSVT